MAAAGPNFLEFYSVMFDEDDPRLSRLRAALSNEGIDRLERREHIYTKSELQAPPLLWLTLRTAERGRLSPRYGTEYDLSAACPLCGTGAIQTSPLLLNPSEIPKKGDIFQIMDHEKLVSLELARALSEAGISGLELRVAQAYKAKVDLPWVQLLAHEQLPPMAPSSKGILREKSCHLCRRDGYFNDAYEPTEIHYKTSELDINKIPDAVYTYEYFDRSRLREPLTDSYFAQPLLLVKPKIFKVLQQQKVRGLVFQPVKIITGDQ